jgi:hypothetical protein
MRVDFYGLAFETPRVTFFLRSPWRSSHLEHRLFDAVRGLPRVEPEEAPDELRLHLTDPKTWRMALQATTRVLKGWKKKRIRPAKNDPGVGCLRPTPITPAMTIRGNS